MPAPAAFSRPAASTVAAGRPRAPPAGCRSGTRLSSAWPSDGRRVKAGPPLAVGSMDLAARSIADRLADHAAPLGRRLSGDALHGASGHRVRTRVVHDPVH